MNYKSGVNLPSHCFNGLWTTCCWSAIESRFFNRKWITSLINVAGKISFARYKIGVPIFNRFMNLRLLWTQKVAIDCHNWHGYNVNMKVVDQVIKIRLDFKSKLIEWWHFRRCYRKLVVIQLLLVVIWWCVSSIYSLIKLWSRTQHMRQPKVLFWNINQTTCSWQNPESHFESISSDIWLMIVETRSSRNPLKSSKKSELGPKWSF